MRRVCPVRLKPAAGAIGPGEPAWRPSGRLRRGAALSYKGLLLRRGRMALMAGVQDIAP
jgi:hypothetical protein